MVHTATAIFALAVALSSTSAVDARVHASFGQSQGLHKFNKRLLDIAGVDGIVNHE